MIMSLISYISFLWFKGYFVWNKKRGKKGKNMSFFLGGNLVHGCESVFRIKSATVWNNAMIHGKLFSLSFCLWKWGG